MVALLFVLLGVLLAVVNRLVPFLSPVVWLIVIIVYVLSLSGIARSQRLNRWSKVMLIGLAMTFGYFAISLLAKTNGWSLLPSLLATVLVFWITSMILGYLKSLKFSVFQKFFVLIGAIVLLIVISTVAWKPLDTQIRKLEGDRQKQFFENLTKPQKTTQPTANTTKPSTATKPSSSTKAAATVPAEPNPILTTIKTNEVIKWIAVVAGVSILSISIYRFKTKGDEQDDPEG